MNLPPIFFDPESGLPSQVLPIAADAESRGWGVQWCEAEDRTWLVIFPKLAPANSEHQDMISMQFVASLDGGFPRLRIFEGYTNSCIGPWDPTGASCAAEEENKYLSDENFFHRVRCLDEALPLFDRACLRYMAEMRKVELRFGGSAPHALSTWRDLEPLASPSWES